MPPFSPGNCRVGDYLQWIHQFKQPHCNSQVRVKRLQFDSVLWPHKLKILLPDYHVFNSAPPCVVVFVSWLFFPLSWSPFIYPTPFLSLSVTFPPYLQYIIALAVHRCCHDPSWSGTFNIFHRGRRRRDWRWGGKSRAISGDSTTLIPACDLSLKFNWSFMTFSHPLQQHRTLANHPPLPTHTHTEQASLCMNILSGVSFINSYPYASANYQLTRQNGSKHPLFSLKGHSSHASPCSRKRYIHEHRQLQTFGFSPEMDCYWFLQPHEIIALQVIM